MKRKIQAMYDEFGKVENKKCKECSNIYKFEKGTMKLKKCRCYGLTHSNATDWNVGFVACGLFNTEYKGKPIMDILKHKKRDKEEVIIEQLEGQLNIFEVL